MAGSDRNLLRSLSLEVYSDVLSQRVFFDEAFSKRLLDLPSHQERAWIFDVVAGALRWRGRIGRMLDSLAAKKPPAGEIRRALELSAYQLLNQDVPPALVVSETVTFIRSRLGEGPAKFANAMLRRIAERRNSSVVVEPWDAAWASLPDWIWKRIVAERGESWARTFAERMLQRPETWLRLKSGAAERLEGGFEGHPGFKDGTAIVQDPGSQKLVDEVADHVGKGPILDLCSAPGGKAIALAWKGFQVTATDASSSRLELVNQNLSRTGLSGAVVVKALEEVLGNPGIWPTVWIDAPCSGSGTLQKNPEIRWIRTEKDLTGLLRIQRDLIETGLRLLKPGGQLVYTVCSVLKEEARIPSAGPIKPLKEWDFALEFGFQGFCITKT